MSNTLKVTFTDSSATQYESSAKLIPFTKGSADKSIGKLYLGDRDSAAFLQLRWRNCSHVVNCQQDMHGLSKEQEVVYCNVDPDVSSKAYEESFQFIDKSLTAGQNVTVLCQTGTVRSAALVLYFLMKKTDTSLANCHELLTEILKKMKKELNLKPDLIKQLMVLEKILRKTASISLDGRKVVYLNGSFNFFNNFRNSNSNGSSKGNGGFPFVALAVFGGSITLLYGILLWMTGGK